LRRAKRILGAGGLIAYPTEAVYGLGCDPLNPEAVLKLLELKRRPVDKGLILIAADFQQLGAFIADPPGGRLRAALRTWPGPTTWVFPAAEGVPSWLTGGHPGLAVRVTAHPLASALCRCWGGALVSTSANHSGRPPARSPLRVRQLFPSGLGLLLHGRLGSASRPTPIRDLLSGKQLRP
jgi:L-threonylcarbamoyladenylate synthase